MNSLKNSVRLVGFVGTDPQIKSFENNRKVARLFLATNEVYKNHSGNWVENTQWHKLVMWDAQADYAEKRLTKGSELSIEGRLVNRTYTDKEGEQRSITEIIVLKMLILSRKKKAALAVDE